MTESLTQTPEASDPQVSDVPGLSIETLMVSAPDADEGAAAQWAVVRVEGEIDVATGPELRRRLVQLVDDGVRHVVLDLSTVPFLDSSALGVFVTGLKRLRIAGGTMRLAACRPPVRAVLKITSLDRVFFLYPSVEAALADETEYLPPTGA